MLNIKNLLILYMHFFNLKMQMLDGFPAKYCF